VVQPRSPPAKAALIFDVSAIVDPDLGVVDRLARLKVAAQRLGCELRIDGACAELLDLVDLMGLTAVLLRVEPGGKTEEREEAVGVEEEGDPAEPIA
jgi:hypothetical protein